MKQQSQESKIELFKNLEEPSSLEQRVLQRIDKREKEISEHSSLVIIEKDSLSTIANKRNIGGKKQLKLMVEEDFLKIKGKGLVLSENVKIPIDSEIKMANKKKEHYPLEDARLFLFFKPKHMISEAVDRTKMDRFTCHKFIEMKWKISQKLYTNTRLDYNCEGLMLFTNNEEMLEVLSKNEHRYEYIYKVKVYGKFDEKKFTNIRQGMVIKGKQIGPFYCNVKRQLKSNTVLEFKTNSPRNRDIKLILQKNNLMMGKCVLEKFGPFSKGQLKQGDFTEVLVPPSVKKFFFEHKKEKIEQANTQMKGNTTND
jgi:23S rRNA pseudouridine2605 synthase